MKRIFITYLFICITLISLAADRYLVSGGTGNWNSTTNWSATDGGGSGASYPVAGDNVFFTTNSSNAAITVNVTSACLSIVASGTYAGQFTVNANITISGTTTFIATMPDIAGTNPIVFNTTATITSGGNSIAGGVTFTGTSQTYTLGDDWDVDGTVILSGVTTTTMTGQTIYAGGSLTQTTTAITSGTTNIVMNGTGTWSNSSTGILQNNLTFNTAGTITVSGDVYYNTGILTYTAGTVTVAGSTLNIILPATSITLNTGGMTWYNCIINTETTTITLLSDLIISNNITAGRTGWPLIINGAYNVNIGGNLTLNQISGVISGTATLVMNGTGTFSMPNITTGQIRSNLKFNTAGTITVSGTINYNTGTLTKTAGTVITTGSTLNIGNANTTLDLNDLTLNNLTLSGTSKVLTLTSGLKVSDVLSATSTGNSIVSSVGGTQRKLTMLASSTQSISSTNNIDATDIDSSEGLPIVSEGGALSNTLNWYSSAGDLTNMFLW